MPEPQLLAAVDLGSNSFRLLVGRVESTAIGEQIRPIDALKEPVRLAAGLGQDGNLSAAAQRRGAEALHRFGERLRSFSPGRVRCVGTNTLRVARNARDFLSTAEAALGFPIEVISGHEEARLIYLGAAHAMALDAQPRLVIDIGGGSTECIIGKNYEAQMLESRPVGCVSMSERFFAQGKVDAASMEHAIYAARAAITPIARDYRRAGWSYAVGSSGTAKALWQAMRTNRGDNTLTLEGLKWFAQLLCEAGHVDRIRVEGLKPERRPVLAGGLAVMTAVFEELRIQSMDYCAGALRQGVLYDVLGREHGADMREVTVTRMAQRYGVDQAHAQRVAATAIGLLSQIARAPDEDLQAARRLLGWAARLAEIGMSISHQDFHKHSAYILNYADMPGFSQPEQTRLANLALAQTGGLRKLRGLISDDLDWLMVLSLRLAAILHRRRDDSEPPHPALFLKRRRLRLELPRAWSSDNPLSDDSLQAEMQAWAEIRLFEELDYQRI